MALHERSMDRFHTSGGTAMGISVIVAKHRYRVYRDGALIFKSSRLNVGRKALRDIAETWLTWRA